MKKFEELNEVEKALRSLIFAAESRNDIVPGHPFPLGEEYLSVKVAEARKVAEEAGIPLAEVEVNAAALERYSDAEDAVLQRRLSIAKAARVHKVDENILRKRCAELIGLI